MHDTQALEHYALRGQARVEGWLSSTAIPVIRCLAATQDRLGVRGPVAEIGVHHGRFFLLLHLLTSADERSVAYDLFDAQDENVDGSGKGDRAAFERNLRLHGGRPQSVVVRAVNSLRLTTAQVLADGAGRARLFSVDGGHTAELTANDLALAESALCPGGLLILDDFFNDSWPGVCEGACRHLSGGSNLVPVVIAGNKFVFTDDEAFARSYQDDLRPLRGHELHEQMFFGRRVIIAAALRGSALRRAVTASSWWRSVRDTTAGRGLRRVLGRR